MKPNPTSGHALDRIHQGEWPAVAISFLYFFCVLAAYYMIRPVREQLSAAVGSTQLPWFYGATFVCMVLLAPVFGAVVSRWPRRIVVPPVSYTHLDVYKRQTIRRGQIAYAAVQLDTSARQTYLCVWLFIHPV